MGVQKFKIDLEPLSQGCPHWLYLDTASPSTSTLAPFSPRRTIFGTETRVWLFLPAQNESGRAMYAGAVTRVPYGNPAVFTFHLSHSANLPK